MITLEEFRSKEIVKGLADGIGKLASDRREPITLMEICGTHTMSIYQYGIRSLLPSQVRLISGPGCPVCVTPVSYVDQSVAYARLPETIIATFGDMLRVPGSTSNLMRERALGADIRIVYSPLDAVNIAAQHPGKKVVFLGVGFETTAPTIAGSIITAASRGLKNFFVHTAHKTIPIPMQALSSDPELRIDGCICPAHVSTIIGANAYRFLAEEHGVPCVATGFEPADVMQGIEMLVRQVVADHSTVEIQYSRFVTWEGNHKAQALVKKVFDPVDAVWRGIGLIPQSGLEIGSEYAAFDAAKAHPVQVEEPVEPPGCQCGEVLRGKITPFDCSLFGTVCTPESPVGACMVSSEGSCAAAHKYGSCA